MKHILILILIIIFSNNIISGQISSNSKSIPRNSIYKITTDNGNGKGAIVVTSSSELLKYLLLCKVYNINCAEFDTLFNEHNEFIGSIEKNNIVELMQYNVISFKNPKNYLFTINKIRIDSLILYCFDEQLLDL